jgi:hypothetical protein
MHTIILFRRPGDCWLSQHSDPEVRCLFGSDTISTAFTANAPAEVVVAEIRRLNPGVYVSVQGEHCPVLR